MKEEEQFQKCFIFFYYYNVNDFTGQRSHVSKSLLSIDSYDKIKCGETVIAFFSRPMNGGMPFSGSLTQGLPRGLSGKESACNEGDMGSIPG